MHKSTSARFYYMTTDAEGKEILRYRSVPNINVESSDSEINQVMEVFEALTLDSYALVEKLETYVIG